MCGAVRAPPTQGFRGVHREHRRGASPQRAAERGAGAGARLFALLTVTQLAPLCRPQAGGIRGDMPGHTGLWGDTCSAPLQPAWAWLTTGTLRQTPNVTTEPSLWLLPALNTRVLTEDVGEQK